MAWLTVYLILSRCGAATSNKRMANVSSHPTGPQTTAHSRPSLLVARWHWGSSFLLVPLAWQLNATLWMNHFEPCGELR